MNKLTICLVLIILFTGCRTSKKVTETSNETSKKIEVAYIVATNKDVKNVTEKKVVTTTVITETNYFPPDTTNEKSGSNIEIKKPGVVKSTKTTVVTETETDKGVTEDKTKIQANTDTKQNENTEAKTSVTEKKTMPIQWWAIFGTLVVLTGLFFYLKNSPIGITIKAFITKIFNKP